MNPQRRLHALFFIVVVFGATAIFYASHPSFDPSSEKTKIKKAERGIAGILRTSDPHMVARQSGEPSLPAEASVYPVSDTKVESENSEIPNPMRVAPKSGKGGKQKNA